MLFKACVLITNGIEVACPWPLEEAKYVAGVWGGRLFSDDLNQRALSAAAVKLAVEDLLPRSEVELAAGDGDHHFASHHLPLQVRVRIVFARAVVQVLRGRLVGRKLFEPFLVIGVQARFIVVNENGSGDVHGVNETETFTDFALPNELLDRGRDIDEAAAGGDFKPEMFSERFQTAEL